MGFWREVQAEIGSEVPAGRGGAACVAIGGRRILCFGGADRTPAAFQDFWLLELTESGGHWTKVSPVMKLSHKRKLLPRTGSSLTYIATEDGSPGKAYLFGGQDPVQGVIFDELLCLDTGSWELTDVQLERPQPHQQQQRPPGRHSHVAGPYEQHGIIVFGGAGLRGPLNDVWLFDTAAAQWRCLSAELGEDESPDAREMAAGTMISDAGLLVHGGRAGDGTLLDDICIFDGRAGRWVLVQQTGFPRCAHTAYNTAVVPQPASTSGGAPAAAAAAVDSKQGQAATAPGGGGASSSAAPSPPPPASNVLLYGGFTGETVASDVLQLNFLRQQRTAGGPGLRAELRPVKAADTAPPPRFAHAAAVLSGPDTAELVVVGGVNQTDDLSDVHVWTV